MYDRLFKPLTIGLREARNRVLFGSHATNLARHNLLSSQHADYYAARAEGGAGIIVLEEHIVHVSDMPYESAVLGYLPNTVQAVAAVAKRIHIHGSLAFVQLNHNGQQSTSGHHQREMWAPSPVPDVSSRETPKEMEQADIRAVVEGFAQVAHNVTQAGADGVELQVADSSLLRQFLSPLTNQRSDTYGGELENRLRFVQETLEAVDAAIGTDSVLGVRFCADELAPWAGLTPEQSLEIVRLLVATGRIDYVTVTMGSILSTHMFPFNASMHVPQGYAVHLAGSIKAAVDIPVFAAGRIMSAEQAERILAEEQADGVEMIRALIADPNLPRLSQEGHAERVRPCMAGLEAARTAALRAREVVLYEREAVLGGTVALAAKGPGRGELQLITDYLVSELERLAVEVHTGIEVTVEMLRGVYPERSELAQHDSYPHTVIIATGAYTGSGLLPIQGHYLPHVTDIRHVLAGEPVDGQRVVVVDETDSHGVLSTVELLASAGKNVEVVTEDFYIGRDLVATHDLVLWKQRVLPHGVTMTPHTIVVRIEPGKVIVVDRFAEGERELPADIVVLGTYERPSQELYMALKDRIPHLFRIGDCVAPRRIEQAILEGRRVGEQV